MPQAIDQLIDSWIDIKLHPKYFRGHPNIKISIGEYTTNGIRGTHPEFVPPHPINFNKDITGYGLVLRAPRKDRVLNAAALGFNSYDRVADCLEIQGGSGRYRELTPIRWDSALLGSLIVLAREAGLDAVLLVPHFLVEGDGAGNHERLMMRYDQNGISHGFKYSESQQRWVLDLKNK